MPNKNNGEPWSGEDITLLFETLDEADEGDVVKEVNRLARLFGRFVAAVRTAFYAKRHDYNYLVSQKTKDIRFPKKTVVRTPQRSRNKISGVTPEDVMKAVERVEKKIDTVIDLLQDVNVETESEDDGIWKA